MPRSPWRQQGGGRAGVVMVTRNLQVSLDKRGCYALTRRRTPPMRAHSGFLAEQEDGDTETSVEHTQ